MAYGAITVPATANGIQIVAKNLSRIVLIIYNNGSNTIFLGTDNSVTISTGYPLAAGTQMVFDFAGDADRHPFFFRGELYGIVAASTEDLRYLELLPENEFD